MDSEKTNEVTNDVTNGAPSCDIEATTDRDSIVAEAVSYTHLTLPTICTV